MPRRPPPSRRSRLLAGALALALLAGLPALAESFTRDVGLGDEVEADIAPGDLHTYRLAAVAGTKLRVRVRARDGEFALSLTLRDPSGAAIDARSGTDVRIDATAAVGGTYRAEVESAGGSGEYEVEVTGTAPSTGGGGAMGPGTFHLDVPRGARVRVDVTRRSGDAPAVTAVRDGAGRALAFQVARASKSRLRIAPVPVSAAGGLDVDVAGAGGGDGTYEVRFRLVDHDDDGPPSQDAARAAGRIVVSLRPGADPYAVAAALGYDLDEDDIGDGFIVLETGSEGTEYEDAARADDDAVVGADVIAAEPDAYLIAPEGVPQGSQSQHVVVGSDLGRTDVVNQPGLDQIQATVAQRTATGAGTLVAVLDTGVDPSHADLAGRVRFDLGWDFIGDGVTPDPLAYEEPGPGGAAAPSPAYGHGTFVAGLIASVAPDAQILPVRVLDPDGRGTVSSVAAGIEWAVARGARVINLSLGMDARSGVIGDAVRYALGNGVIVVAATGNGAQPGAVSFPASVSGVVAVTATDPSTLGPAPFANGGPAATVAAPGAALVGPVASNPAGQYGTWSGTSFSAALASGGAALLVQTRPAITPAQAAQRFRRTARAAPRGLTAAQRRRLGGGRLDLARLVR